MKVFLGKFKYGLHKDLKCAEAVKIRHNVKYGLF